MCCGLKRILIVSQTCAARLKSDRRMPKKITANGLDVGQHGRRLLQIGFAAFLVDLVCCSVVTRLIHPHPWEFVQGQKLGDEREPASHTPKIGMALPALVRRPNWVIDLHRAGQHSTVKQSRRTVTTAGCLGCDTTRC